MAVHLCTVFHSTIKPAGLIGSVNTHLQCLVDPVHKLFGFRLDPGAARAHSPPFLIVVVFGGDDFAAVVTIDVNFITGAGSIAKGRADLLSRLFIGACLAQLTF